MHKHRTLATTVAFLSLCYSAPHAMAQTSTDIGDSSSLVTHGQACNLLYSPFLNRYIPNGTIDTNPVGPVYAVSREPVGVAQACFCDCIKDDGSRRVKSNEIGTRTWTTVESSGWEWSASVGTSNAQFGVAYHSDGSSEYSVQVDRFTLSATCQSKRVKKVRLDKQRQRTSMNAYTAHCYIEPGSLTETYHRDDIYGRTQTSAIHYDKWTYTPILEQSVLLRCASGDYQ